MEQSVHRPLSQSGLPIVRRVNSAIGERVGLDLLRRPRRPVVTDSSIDPSTHPHRTALDASAPRLRAHAADAASAHRGGGSPDAPAALHAAKRASRREEAGASQTRPLVAALPPLPDVYNPREGSAGPARIGCRKLEEFSIADRRGSAGRALGRQSADRRALRARPFAAAVGNPRALRVFDSGGAGRSGSGVVGIQPINASNFGLKRYIYIEG